MPLLPAYLLLVSTSVRIGNFLVSAPCGIAFVVRDQAAFVVDTGGPYTAGTAAPDDSYHRQTFFQKGAWVTLEWGRIGDSAVARLRADRPTVVSLKLSAGWPDLRSSFRPVAYGAVGTAQVDGSPVRWRLAARPGPVLQAPNEVVLPVEPDKPARFVAGFDPLPQISSVDSTLESARLNYARRRPAASGAWGDFVAAIADNMNNSRIYSTDNHRLAHSVSRRWAGGNPNADPYFCWDSFFTALLASIDDPVGARDTVRAILSCTTPEGFVPNFAHWNFGNSRSSDDRSQPPVGALCVWRMHERRSDLAFLREVYPKLLRWHNWWPKYRDANHNGLLEWGSATRDWQNAQYETGWDDNLHFAGTRMVGAHMNADAVDLTSLWSMDALFLSKIASAIGRRADATRLAAEHLATNRRIDALLWNPKLGLYCSRRWMPEKLVPVSPEAFAGGFSGDFFADETLGAVTAHATAPRLDFNWNGKSPAVGIPGNHWSARWVTTFTPPTSGPYRFTASADDGVRVFVDGHQIITDWSVHPARELSNDVRLEGGKPIPIAIEYFQHEGGASLRFDVSRISAAGPNDAFLTRITPMNFYPLLAGVPKGDRAASVIRRLTDPATFWGKYLLPTLPYGDPNYPQQQYWRGDVWGPVNYLLWEGIRRYATPEHRRQYAERSVRLFMQNWRHGHVCSENYYSTTGRPGGDPHYTWGALLCLVGLEYVEESPLAGIRLINFPGSSAP